MAPPPEDIDCEGLSRIAGREKIFVCMNIRARVSSAS